jgi:hypothetical protein
MLLVVRWCTALLKEPCTVFVLYSHESFPVEAKLSILVWLFLLQGLCHLLCELPVAVPWPPAISKELVFSPHGEAMRSHPGVAAQRALPLKYLRCRSLTTCVVLRMQVDLLGGNGSMVMQERALLAGLSLCNDTEQRCV